jgi:hypothetical protein
MSSQLEPILNHNLVWLENDQKAFINLTTTYKSTKNIEDYEKMVEFDHERQGSVLSFKDKIDDFKKSKDIKTIRFQQKQMEKFLNITKELIKNNINDLEKLESGLKKELKVLEENIKYIEKDNSEQTNLESNPSIKICKATVKNIKKDIFVFDALLVWFDVLVTESNRAGKSWLNQVSTY